VLCFLGLNSGYAQSSNKNQYPAKDQTTYGSVTVEGHKIAYKAIAGTIPLFNSHRDTTAHIFFVAYFKKGVDNPSQRPLTFLYNGGPGSASVWLHMGAFGPKRVDAGDTAHIEGPPYKLVNNDYSLLDASDLVFIDAPGTGFSRLTNKGNGDSFYGVYQDANAFANFITGFITKYGRWNAPKFLLGESYGTTRNAVLSNILITDKSVGLNGVIMLSQILNFGFSIDSPDSDPGNYLPYVLGLPTYAATAWYHHKLPVAKRPQLKPFLKKAEHFATGPYAEALAKGSALSEGRFNQIAQKMHQYTGLSVRYLKKANLRVSGREFEKNLLVNSLESIGRLDSRFKGPTIEPLSRDSKYDPQSASISAAYIGLFNRYVRKTLHFGKHMKYRPLYPHHWDFKYHGHLRRNVMPDLAHAMKYNPHLKVMLNGGYFDLATPYMEGKYEMHHLPISKKLQKNISYHYYKSGHMVYVKPQALKRLHDNVAAFIKKNDNVGD
jgi:carboxypeptidase C (cathepsin A)